MEDAASPGACGFFSLIFGRRNRSPAPEKPQTISNSPKARKQPPTISNSPKARKQPPTISNYPKARKQPQMISNSPMPQKQPDRIIGQRPAQHTPATHQGQSAARKSPQAGIQLSGELESIIADYQRSKGNMAVYGNLGNLRQGGNGNNAAAAAVANTKYSTENVVKKNQGPVSLCRAISTRMDPEELKILGNEDYRNGRFAEALSLYDAAIAIDPDKASYRSNRSAALVALGKLLEAALECREAIRIHPSYQRAHNRLALIYVRLGEAERALYHFKQAGSEADPDAIDKAKQIQIHLNKCTDSKRQRDWNTLCKEAALAIDVGADSAPTIFGLKAEALLKLNRHQEAIETMEKSPNFDADLCIKFFGPIGSSSLLVFQAQVDLVSGRFDDAVAAAQRAAKLDPNNRDASMILNKARAVAVSRLNGNEQFKGGRYSEACIAYSEGLNHDAYNAVLLCNRAACRSKLSQFEKALEDCNAALRVRPSYTKARLRRADCYAKIGKWGACIQDCEVLLKVNPDDEEIGKMMEEAKAQINNSNKGCVSS